MNRKQLGILLVLVLVVGGAGLVIYNKKKQSLSAGNSGIGRKLLPDFPVNEVALVRISHDTNTVTLLKKDGSWRVSERENYPANFSQLSEFLIKVRDLKAVQSEQAGTSQLARLQLAPGQGTNSPTIVEFKGADDKAINELHLGKLHMSSGRGSQFGGNAGGWPDGRYVKTAADAYVALISDPLQNIEPRPEQWLNKDFFRVEKARSIEVVFPEATNSWKLTRETENGDWKLADANVEEELDSGNIASVTHPFGSPSFNDVFSANEFGEETKAVVLKVSTFDGFTYTVHVGEKREEGFPIKLAVAAEIVSERDAPADETPEDKARLDEEFKNRRQTLEEKLKREQAFQNWTYLVSTWSVEPLLKKRAELLKDKSDDAEMSDDETDDLENEIEPESESGAHAEH